MDREYTVSVTIGVYDEQALYEAAKKQARNDGWGTSTIRECLGTKKNPSVTNCLRIVIDPGVSPDGCTIYDSVCE